MANTTTNAPANRKKARLEKSYFGYIFIAPFFIIYAIFSLYPLLSTFFYAFTDKVQFNPEFNMVGFDNFVKIFETKNYLDAFITTPTMWLMGFVPQLLLALLLAAWFTDAKIKIKGQGFFKVIFYMPNIMTAATIGGLFFAFMQNGSFLHEIALNLGFISKASQPLSGDVFGKGIVSFINFWMWYGNTMIILIAGILGINPSLFEAAQIDGANGMQVFYKITLPLIKPILTYSLVQSLIGGFQMFDVPVILAGEGSTITKFITTIMMQLKAVSFQGQNSVGVGAAISILLFILTTVFSVLIFAIMKDRSEARYMKKQKQLMKQQRQGGAN